ncbi:MAG: hypothetical protein LBH12_05805, partial [Dysgonamonadaceae bacterium]|nr:hypothetical protein [Dysgonamonadaceae bacterium]
MAQLLYKNEHLSCPNYETGRHPVIEVRQIFEGGVFHVRSQTNKLVFVLEGRGEYSTGSEFLYPAIRGHILFSVPERHLSIRTSEDTELLVIRLHGKINLCDCFDLEELNRVRDDIPMDSFEEMETRPFFLEMNTVMEKYVEMLLLCYKKGLRCRYYNEGKIRELMYIFRAFYPKEDLYRFFEPALASDSKFAQQVMRNYNDYGNLLEIATAMN